MAEAALLNEDIYNITVECSTIFGYLVKPKLPSKTKPETADNPDTLGHSSSQGERPAGNLKTTFGSQVKYGGDYKNNRGTKIEEMERSFNLWINYTGALAAVGRSLDDRLKGHTDIKEMVVELLQMLARNLQYSMYRHDFLVRGLHLLTVS